MQVTPSCVILAIAAIGCSSNDPAGSDAARPSDAVCIAPDPTPYAMACTTEPDDCPAPYECTMVSDNGIPPTLHCLTACTQGCDCPVNCICKGVNGGASWGPDGYCICV